MTPWLQDADVTLYHGDVLDVLCELPAESVDCVVTSPPYWGLRDYGTGAWEGGDEACDHDQRRRENDPDSLSAQQIGPARDSLAGRDKCRKCGATRIDQQLGLEPTPEAYVERMVEVFSQVRRVLAAHGTVWLNLGDSYASQGARGDTRSGFNERYFGSGNLGKQAATAAEVPPNSVPAGLKPKDLVGIPWRVAFALQADGWYLRSDIIWAKPNPMPESVTDRPTKAHEYVFLLSKQPRYFFDQEAVREVAHDWGQRTREIGEAFTNGVMPNGSPHSGLRDLDFALRGRNIRSVWEIATQPYPEAHFATFPEELARRCIAAGTSEWGKCPECGSPWVRVTAVEDGTGPKKRGPNNHAVTKEVWGTGGGNSGLSEFKDHATRSTIGWIPSCACFDGPDPCITGLDPAVVLDPFIGSGTVAYVARKLGRHAVGIDLNAEYLELAARRLQQQSLFASEVAS